MAERSLIYQEREKIEQIILDRLKKGPIYRKDLHLLCCQKLGKSTQPSLKPSRICENMQDSQFDVPLKGLLESGLVRKVGNIGRKGNFMYYKLIQKKG